MTAQLIDGKAVAAAIHEEVRAAAAELKAKYGIAPGLATVLVGDNPASHSYVKAKRQGPCLSRRPGADSACPRDNGSHAQQTGGVSPAPVHAV